MDASTEAQRRERLQEILALAHARLPAERHPAFDLFAAESFAQLDADDLADRGVEDLAGALLSHWQFGAQRTPGSPKTAGRRVTPWSRSSTMTCRSSSTRQSSTSTARV
jgi:glutamate dehydrogenase